MSQSALARLKNPIGFNIHIVNDLPQPRAKQYNPRVVLLLVRQKITSTTPEILNNGCATLLSYLVNLVFSCI